ncbi:MAG TPA: tetratricopeptide repeat protein [Methanoregula sp.]|nr:tetratricopeptide repeat protein [Methanoregula sp.]
MDSNALMEKAHRFARIGRYDEAIACFDKVLEIDGKNTTAMENKGKIYYSLGWYEDAITWYDKALAINKNLVSAWFEKGYTLRKIQRYEEAIIVKNLKFDTKFTPEEFSNPCFGETQ